jgi:hypothetical protein
MQTRITEIATALNARADDLDAAYAPRLSSLRETSGG